MKGQSPGIRIGVTAAALIFASSVQASPFFGEAVSAGGVNDGPAGLPPVSNTIEYFIPLASSHSGTYGESKAGICVGSGEKGVGTCKDSGSGYKYDEAGSLNLNLFFDMSGAPASSAAILSINFDDLDLLPINDPAGFTESVKFSYWNEDSADFVGVGGVIKNANDLTSGAFLGAATTNPDPLTDPVNHDPFDWHLDLAALNILNNTGGLNDSVANLGGFWIQLGFGSQYVYTRSTAPNHYKIGKPRDGTNTSEFLTAQLNVSPVPVPAAFWLFGTALIGFVGMSRRIRIS